MFLWQLLSHAEEKCITALVHEMNTLEFPMSKVRLKFALSQWGSCSPKKVVMINAALLFTPLSVLRYVIAHELSHLIHNNHSKAYWKDAERMMPDYEEARRRLKRYRLPDL